MKALSTVTAGLKADNVIARLVEQHQIVVQARDMVLGWAHQGMTALVAAGEILVSAQEGLSGDFEEWLESVISSMPAELKFSRSTAYNYMRAVRFKAALDQDCPEFTSIKELYIAAGILPMPPENGSKGKTPPALFAITFKLNAPPPEEWEPLDRREFLAKAKPVVDLYERVRQAEAAA